MSQMMEMMRVEIGDRTYGVLRSDMQSVQHGNRVRVKPEGSHPPAVLPTTQGNLPVYSLGDVLDVPHSVGFDRQRVLILHSKWGLWGMTVDRIQQWELINESELQPFPAVARTSDKAFFKSIMAREGEVLLVLNPKQLHPDAAPMYQTGAVKTDVPFVKLGKEKGQLVLITPSGLNGHADTLALGFIPKQIVEVLRKPTIHPIPSAPNDVRGIIHWRGQAVPVLDMAARLGLRDADGSLTDAQRVIVTIGANSDRAIGFFAKSSIDFLELPAQHQPVDIPADFPQSLLRGVAMYKERMVLIPKIDQLAA